MRLLLLHPATFDPTALVQHCAKQDTTIRSTAAQQELVAGKNGDDFLNFDCLMLAGDNSALQSSDLELAEGLLKLYDGGESAAARAKPPTIVGLGWGFGMVCAMAGDNLNDIADRGPAAEVMRPTEDGARLFQGTEPIKVAASERWYVDQLARQLQTLATSESGIEAVRHKKLPVYGLQLLPADFVYPSDGWLVFANLLSAVGRR